MRQHNDEQLQSWAHQIGQRLQQNNWPAAYLVYHGSPGAEGPSTAHAENTQNVHVLELYNVTVDDLNRLREFLIDFGIKDVTVKQANPGGSRTVSAEVPQPAPEPPTDS